MGQDPTRRALILTAVATGACLASLKSAVAEEDRPGSNERPRRPTFWFSPKGNVPAR